MPFLAYLGSGFLLGLAAGIAPGPLFALVITETMRSGLRSGIHVSMAPFFTDLPLAIISAFVFSQVTHLETVLGIVSLIGAAVLLYYAWENITLQRVAVASTKSRRAFVKGLLTNVFSPHPYLFFFTVGGVLVAQALAERTLFAVVFILTFVCTLVLSKITLATITHYSKRFVTGKAYVYTVRSLGVMLVLFALHLVYKGALFLR